MRSNVKGGDVSREGVQRDLLPLVEGTTINTKYGMIKTDHILFVASGAFMFQNQQIYCLNCKADFNSRAIKAFK